MSLLRSVTLCFSVLMLSLPTLPQASAQEALFGEWGTENQCARELITPKGTKLAEPFVISQDWIGHGNLWCRLTWLGSDAGQGPSVTFAQGQCGEDSVRGYQMKFQLEGEELSIIWNSFHKNGPLQRCDL